MSEQLIKTPCTFGDNGNFLLERELGSGGMGGVYMGRDKMLDRPVAVKVMLKELGNDAEFVEKFKREAQSVARLIHPNIAQVYSYGICDGMPYIAMELASGGSLFSIMNANPGKTDVARVIKICQQVAQALQCASDQGCVHGDVKPENILLDANGNAKLVDFGLAAMQKDTDEIWGTPYYISPEKVRKEPIDFRADMYSLGGTLYHALTGVAPFEGDDAIAVVKQRFNGPPKKPSELRPEITPAIDALVMKMLALEKEDRYPSFEALLEAFKEVLTSGLTKKIDGAVAASARQTGTGKRMPMRTRRIVRPGMRTGTTTIRRKLESGEAGDEGAVDETEKKPSSDDEEDEGGGNLGLKVAGVVVGVVVLVAAVVGGLVWYQVSSKSAQEAEMKAQILEQTEKASTAIADTVSKARKFADEFDAFAMRAVVECEKPTAELSKMLPPEQAAMLKPAPTKELLDAIASTNDAPVAAEAPAAAPAATNAAPASATNAVPAAATNAPPASAAAGAKADEKKPAEQPPEVVIAINELWERAYACQACAIRIRKSVVDIVKKSAEADAFSEPSRENMEKLGEISRSLVEMFEQVKSSKDVEAVRKGIAYIKSKGEKTVEQTGKRLRIEKLEAERKAKAEAAAEAEKARQEKLAEERKSLVEEEAKAAQDKFDTISAQGCFRQQDWKTALRLLENLRSECKTAEGQLAVDLQVRKVNSMAKLYDIFIKNLPEHKGTPAFVFQKAKLKGAKVVSVNDKEMQLERGKKRMRITWQRFHRENYANLLELMNRYAFNGRRNAGLSQRDVAEALTGGALVLQLICGEEGTAIERAETLAKAAVKEFPDYLKTAQAIFPDIKFEETEE